MRKVLVLLLAILMVFAVVACKQEPDEKKGELPVDKETGKEKLIDQGAAAKAVDHTGFKITVVLDDGEEKESFNIGGKDGVYWLDVGLPMFFRDHDNKTYYYVDLLGWLKVAEGSLKDNVFNELVDSLLYNAYEDDIKEALIDAGSETIKGRNCSKYTVSVTEQGVTYKFSIWVDKEYGITMGMEAMAGSEAFTYTIDPKLSGLVSGDLPTGYATAFACDTYYDSYSL